MSYMKYEKPKNKQSWPKLIQKWWFSLSHLLYVIDVPIEKPHQNILCDAGSDWLCKPVSRCASLVSLFPQRKFANISKICVSDSWSVSVQVWRVTAEWPQPVTVLVLFFCCFFLIKKQFSSFFHFGYLWHIYGFDRWNSWLLIHLDRPLCGSHGNVTEGREQLYHWRGPSPFS